MKGIIRENLGESRYIVGVPLAVQPLADEIKKYTKLYQATIPKITDAFKALAEARDGYALLLAAVSTAAAEYELCRLDFSSTSCIEAGEMACLNAYSEAENTCYEIESGPAPGECDPDCQRERERCIAAAVKVRDACLDVVALDCAEQEYAHLQECQATHSPIIAKAQAAALEKLPAIQEAMYNLQHEQAIQFSLARKLNELEAIAAREYEITCFKAQYDAELATGTEVEMAKTPNGRHAITGIITAPTPCLHDSRVLPSGHLFVNAALYPGFETWRPTWRVGTVKEVIAPDLKVQFAPANLAGSLGTLYSENPIDCTPPQAYFDGKDPKQAEADIVTARKALADAQQALIDAVKVQNDCIAEFDQAWMDQCYGTAVEICDETYSASIDPAIQDRAACYADGPANCETSVADGLAACEAAFQPAIDEKQGLVDEAQGVVTTTAQDLVDAQQALADIEAEIQACIDPINTQTWLDEERVRLEKLCDDEANEQKKQCLDNGGTSENCQIVWDSFHDDCMGLIDDQLPIRQAAAIRKCRDDREAELYAAHAAVDEAYPTAMQAVTALDNATVALAAAEKDLSDCNKNWDIGKCIASAIAVCDDTYTQATELFTLAKAACYEEAMRACDEQRDNAIQACRDANAGAIEAAQLIVDGAVRDVEIATNGRYQPADPLILDVPVAHCGASEYQVDDEVLIDFPVRSGTAMAVWDSRRVIGWATETRACCCGGLDLSVSGDLKSWYLLRRRQGNFGWDEINTPDHTLACEDNALYIHSEATQAEDSEVQFFGLVPVPNASISFDVKIELSGDAVVTIAQGAEEADNYEILIEQSTNWVRYCYNYLDWIGPRFGLWTDPGDTAKVWIRAARGPVIGFCEINAEDDSAALAELTNLRAARDAASLAYQDYLAAKDACYTAVLAAFTQAKLDCQANYPLGYCVKQCVISGQNIWDCTASCGATLQDYEDYNICLTTATSAYNAGNRACNDIYTAEAQAAAAAPSIAAQAALDAFFNLQPCSIAG